MELDYNRIDPELAATLEQMPKVLGTINRKNIGVVRDNMLQQRAALPQVEPLPEQRTIAGPDGSVDVYVYRGEQASDVGPGMVWIHGGGYILGSALDERARTIANRIQGTVVSVDYRLAPEHPFPAGSEDCYTALQWTAANAAELQIDPTRLAIGGASAGGGMAAGLALMNRDRGGPALAMQLLLYPMIDNLHETASGKYTNHPVWKRATSFNAWEMYLDGVPGPDASPYAAASRATDLSGLPPAYVSVGSEDLFRDEDIDYARRLSEAGVPCELGVFPGMFHGGDGLVPQAKISRRMNESFLVALEHGLS